MMNKMNKANAKGVAGMANKPVNPGKPATANAGASRMPVQASTPKLPPKVGYGKK